LVEPWSVRRSAILSKYTTSEKLSIVTSFLPGGEKGTYFFKSLSINSILQNNLYSNTVLLILNCCNITLSQL